MRPKRPLPTLPFAKSAATPRPERCRSDHRGQSNPGALYLPRLSACHPDSDPDTVTIVVIASAAVNGPPFAAVQIMCHQVSFERYRFATASKAS